LDAQRPTDDIPGFLRYLLGRNFWGSAALEGVSLAFVFKGATSSPVSDTSLFWCFQYCADIVNPSWWLRAWEFSRAIGAAFALFGIYRIWISIIEGCPNHFYATSGSGQIPKKYRYVEPGLRGETRCDPDEPVVDLGIDTARPNLIVGLIYIAVAVGVLLIRC
jgi:hypothetical protein